MYFKAASFDYSVICQTAKAGLVYPYFRIEGGDKTITCISPHHGRSFVVGQTEDGRYVVSKGNGLSYTQHVILKTGEMGDNVWGGLLKKDAIRDFNLGKEISDFGIKTNQMEYVLELETNILQPSTEHPMKPVLLQYTVECPYRICDIAFMTTQQVKNEIGKWKYFDTKYTESYLIATEVLVRNLRILHSNNILHNAIHVQNFTWALELLDFELASSPQFPYDKETSNIYIQDLFPREILYTYEVVNYIAWCLNEYVDYEKIDFIFKEYGFDLEKLSV